MKVYVLERDEHERYADRVFSTLAGAMAAFPVTATESQARRQRPGGWQEHEPDPDEAEALNPKDRRRAWWNGYTFADAGIIIEMELEP